MCIKCSCSVFPVAKGNAVLYCVYIRAVVVLETIVHVGAGCALVMTLVIVPRVCVQNSASQDYCNDCQHIVHCRSDVAACSSEIESSGCVLLMGGVRVTQIVAL